MGDLTATGGWTAPSDTVYDASLLAPVEFPAINTHRGGVTFSLRRRTPAEARAYEAVQARLRRTLDTLLAREHDAIEAACRTALAEGWDIHLYRHPLQMHTLEDRVKVTAYIGIEFQPARYPVPTIVEHHDHDVSWTDDDEWEA